MSKCPMCNKGNLYDYMLKPISRDFIIMEEEIKNIGYLMDKIKRKKPIDKIRLAELSFKKDVLSETIDKISKDYRVCLSCFTLVKKYGRDEAMDITLVNRNRKNKQQSWRR